MPQHSSRNSPADASTGAGMWAFRIAVLLMIGGMVGFVLYDSYASKTGAPAGATPAASGTPAGQQDGGDAEPELREDEVPSHIAPLPKEVPPWEASEDAEIPEGHLSPAEVNPPGPEPTLTAPEAVPPPDPLTHEPPKHNPGGVNGDRPPRNLPSTPSD